MSVLERALKSIAVTLADEAKTYGVSIPPLPNSDDPKSVLEFLKTVADEIAKVAGASVAKECLNTLEAFLSGNASEEDVMIKCPSLEDLPASPLDPFKERIYFDFIAFTPPKKSFIFLERRKRTRSGVGQPGSPPGS